jgi:cell division protein FtsB
MSIGWPGAIVLVALLFSAVAVYGTVVAAKANKADREAKVVYGEQYRQLSESYEALAKETHDLQIGMRDDLAAVRATVESIEQMMRDVG